MKRLRVIYSKRGLFSFVPHTSLPQIFASAARRAGLGFHYSEGFSPRPKISLGPALPVGVPALAEPADLYFLSWDEQILGQWKANLPQGLALKSWGAVEGKNLSKLCKAASYLVFPRTDTPLSVIERKLASSQAGELSLDFLVRDGGLSITLPDPQQYGPGFIVKILVAEGVIKNWSEIAIIRTSIVNMIDGRITPLL